MKALDALARRQLVVVTGKGGVGKTTLTAALGRLLAARGRKTLLLETDPRENLHQMLRTDPSGGAFVKAGPRLALQNLQPRAVIEALVKEKVRIGVVAKKILASPIFQHFADGAPGLKEMAVLGYALRTVQGDYKHKADVVVLDAPATGHGASMLSAPLLLADAVGGGQLGDMAAELGGFIADSKRTGVILVTLAEEMPVQETIELISLLNARMGRPPEMVIANALYPPFPNKPPSKAAGEMEPELVELWRQRRAVNERELGRLRGFWKGGLVELPLMPIEPGPGLLAELEGLLEESLA
jgi:Mrp family chromosome partitioning ATPase